jgi:thioredoxin 1
MAKELTAAQFQSAVLAAQKPVLVDFWASWCGPCRALAPVIEELSVDLQDKLDVYKCNVDEEGTLAQQFGIMSIPTLLLFKDGEVVERLVGAMPKSQLISEIEDYL